MLLKALNFAKQYVPIEDAEMEIIFHARKFLLCFEESIWVKKSGDPLFDVPMGAFDGAELCVLIGAYILQRLKLDFPLIDAGLYRDDGLIITHNFNGHDLDRLRKDLFTFFLRLGLRIR